MKIIFLKDVPKVGKKDEIKEVSDGYAINFLLPKKLGMVATAQSIAVIENKKKEVIVGSKIKEDLLIKNLESIRDKVVHISGKVNEKGSLFSAIHEKEIVEGLKKQHHAELDKDCIMLEKPIKELGEFVVPVKIKGHKTSFKVIISKA